MVLRVRFPGPGVLLEKIVFQAVVLAGAAVSAEQVPPKAAADLGLEWGQAKPASIAMYAQRFRNANGEAVQNPDAFAAVVDPQS